MGFWNTLEALADAGVKAIIERKAETGELYKRAQLKSDTALLRDAKKGDLLTSGAAIKELQNRGYSSEDILRMSYYS